MQESLEHMLAFSICTDSDKSFTQDVQIRVTKNFSKGNNHLANDALGRLFSTWVILSGSLCFGLVYDPRNVTLMYMAFFSFLLVLWYFVSEWLIWKTVKLHGSATTMIIACKLWLRN